MVRLLLIMAIFFSVTFAQDTNKSAALIKQQMEIKELKKQLNDFYNKKEKEYQTRKKELLDLINKVEKEKKEIKALHDNNAKILSDIKGEVESKTAKIYNKMKPKVAAGIFNQMINEGKIEDVFDIILKLKEKNVTLLMKFLSPKNAAMLTVMLKNYRVNNQN